MAFESNHYQCWICGKHKKAWVKSRCYKEKVCPKCIDGPIEDIMLKIQTSGKAFRGSKEVTFESEKARENANELMEAITEAKGGGSKWDEWIRYLKS